MTACQPEPGLAFTAQDPVTAAALRCPAWCELPEGHGNDTGSEIDRTHRRVVGTALIGPPHTFGGTLPAIVAVSVEQGSWLDLEDASVTVSPARVQIDGIPPEGLPPVTAATVAAVVADAAHLLDGEPR